MKTIFGNEAAFNITAGSIAMIASGAGTIFYPVGTKTALAAISTIASGERALVKESVYKNAVVAAVTRKIHEGREQKASAIMPATSGKSINDYSMTTALRDVVDFYYKCTFMYGLDRALEEGSTPSGEARERSRSWARRQTGRGP